MVFSIKGTPHTMIAYSVRIISINSSKTYCNQLIYLFLRNFFFVSIFLHVSSLIFNCTHNLVIRWSTKLGPTAKRFGLTHVPVALPSPPSKLRLSLKQSQSEKEKLVQENSMLIKELRKKLNDESHEVSLLLGLRRRFSVHPSLKYKKKARQTARTSIKSKRNIGTWCP
jgi:hypothetical protein